MEFLSSCTAFCSCQPNQTPDKRHFCIASIYPTVAPCPGSQAGGVGDAGVAIAGEAGGAGVVRVDIWTLEIWDVSPGHIQVTNPVQVYTGSKAGAAWGGAGEEWDIDNFNIFTTDSVSIVRLG